MVLDTRAICIASIIVVAAVVVVIFSPLGIEGLWKNYLIQLIAYLYNVLCAVVGYISKNWLILYIMVLVDLILTGIGMFTLIGEIEA